jgi:hypothetical protein
MNGAQRVLGYFMTGPPANPHLRWGSRSLPAHLRLVVSHPSAKNAEGWGTRQMASARKEELAVEKGLHDFSPPDTNDA